MSGSSKKSESDLPIEERAGEDRTSGVLDTSSPPSSPADRESGAGPVFEIDARHAEAPLTGGEREQIAALLGIVRREAASVAAAYAGATRFEDLLGPGTLSLIRAFRGARIKAGPVFEGYLAIRVRGAMLDAIDAERLSVRKRVELAMERGAARGEALTADTYERDPGGSLSACSEAMMDEAFHTVLSASLGVFRASQPSVEEKIAEVEHFLAAVRVVRQALASLDEEARRAFLLYFEEEKTLEDIAGAQGVSRATVHRIITRAGKRLRAAMFAGGVYYPPEEVDLEIDLEGSEWGGSERPRGGD